MKNSRGELKGTIEFGNIREMKERILGDNKKRARLKNQIFLISFGSNFSSCITCPYLNFNTT